MNLFVRIVASITVKRYKPLRAYRGKICGRGDDEYTALRVRAREETLSESGFGRQYIYGG